MIYNFVKLFFVFAILGISMSKNYNVQVRPTRPYEIPPHQETNYVCAVFDTAYLPDVGHLWIDRITNQYSEDEVHHYVLYGIPHGHPYQNAVHGSIVENCYPEMNNPFETVQSDIIFAAQHGNQEQREYPYNTGYAIGHVNRNYSRIFMQVHAHVDHTMMRSEGEKMKVNFGTMLRLTDEMPAGGEITTVITGAYPHPTIRIPKMAPMSVTRFEMPTTGADPRAYCITNGVKTLRLGSLELVANAFGDALNDPLVGYEELMSGIHGHAMITYGKATLTKFLGPEVIMDEFDRPVQGSHPDNVHVHSIGKPVSFLDTHTLECHYRPDWHEGGMGDMGGGHDGHSTRHSGSGDPADYWTGGDGSNQEMCLRFQFARVSKPARTVRLIAPRAVCNDYRNGHCDGNAPDYWMNLQNVPDHFDNGRVYQGVDSDENSPTYGCFRYIEVSP